MGSIEAGTAIVEGWDDIGPLLDDVELRSIIAALGQTRGLVDVLRIVSAVLAPDSPVWEQLEATKSRRTAGPKPVDGPEMTLRLCAEQELERRAEQSTHAQWTSTLDAIIETAPSIAPDLAPPEAVVVWVSGRPVVPTFQLNRVSPGDSHTDLRWRVVPCVAAVNEQLHADIDPRGTIIWWLTYNGWLGATPAALLGTVREPEISYAASQLANDGF